MVRDRLQKAVNGVERVRGKRSGDNPLVVRLVQRLVQQRVVQPAVNQVNPEIRKHYKQRKLGPQVPGGIVVQLPVELRVPSELGDKAHGRQQRHERNGAKGLLDFQANLVSQKLGVLHGLLIKHQRIAEPGDTQIQDGAKDGHNRGEGHELAEHVGAGKRRGHCVLGRGKQETRVAVHVLGGMREQFAEGRDGREQRCRRVAGGGGSKGRGQLEVEGLCDRGRPGSGTWEGRRVDSV